MKCRKQLTKNVVVFRQDSLVLCVPGTAMLTLICQFHTRCRRYRNSSTARNNSLHNLSPWTYNYPFPRSEARINVTVIKGELSDLDAVILSVIHHLQYLSDSTN
jgi:hypothetical protein